MANCIKRYDQIVKDTVDSVDDILPLSGTCGEYGVTITDYNACSVSQFSSALKKTSAFTVDMATGALTGDLPMGFSSTPFADRVEITHNLGNADSYSVSAISDSATPQITTVQQSDNSFNLYQFSGGVYNGTGKVRIVVGY